MRLLIARASVGVASSAALLGAAPDAAPDATSVVALGAASRMAPSARAHRATVGHVLMTQYAVAVMVALMVAAAAAAAAVA